MDLQDRFHHTSQPEPRFAYLGLGLFIYKMGAWSLCSEDPVRSDVSEKCLPLASLITKTCSHLHPVHSRENLPKAHVWRLWQGG